MVNIPHLCIHLYKTDLVFKLLIQLFAMYYYKMYNFNLKKIRCYFVHIKKSKKN